MTEKIPSTKKKLTRTSCGGDAAAEDRLMRPANHRRGLCRLRRGSPRCHGATDSQSVT